MQPMDPTFNGKINQNSATYHMSLEDEYYIENETGSLDR